jgi:hypothetical protein
VTGGPPLLQRSEVRGTASDSVETPFDRASLETPETPCISVLLRKLNAFRYMKLERFPKLDVVGSSPISRSTYSDFRTTVRHLVNVAFIG